PFKGSFKCDLNTDGFPLYAILNLSIHTAESVYVDEGMSKWEAALFGGAKDSTFENIYILNAKIKNDNYGDNRIGATYEDIRYGMDDMPTAPLIGQSVNSTVIGCGATGVVDARSNGCGGLIGQVKGGSVQNCWSIVNVKTLGKWNPGGLVASAGENATISNCFATGNVEGTQSTIGALIGSANSVIVQNCYATGNARDGFIARIENSTVSNCYYAGNATAGGSSCEVLASTVSNGWYLSGKALTHEGYKQGSAADIKAAFASISEWDTSGELPVLKSVKKPDDFSGYKAGAVFGTPSQPQANTSSTPSDTTSSQVSSSETTQALMSIEELTDLINKLPIAELVTLDNKEDIKKAIAAYESLSETDKDNFDLLIYKKLTEAKKAVSSLMVADLSNRIEALPEAKKLKEADKKEVEAIYEDFNFLDEDFKAYISEELRTKLENCVKALENATQTGASSSAFTTSEILVLVLLAAVIFFNAAANIVITIIFFNKKRKAAIEDGGSDYED
ncbi:MAG: hypothetical protein J6J13_02395, partial [Clostridia bacterium]|nr:hypothetical protein [Clostridia bacterium]